MTQSNGIKPKITRIAPSQVTTDLRVQRPLDGKRVAAIVKDFRAEALGVPTVSLREDGTMIWLDGQTRGAALKELGLGDRAIQVSTYEGLSLKQEADLFRILNDSKRLTSVDLFRIAVTAEDPIAVAADKAVQVQGWTTEGGRRNSLRAVNMLYSCYEQDAAALKLTLFVLAGAWGASTHAAQAFLMRGVWLVFSRYGGSHTIDADRMRDRLAREPGGPEQFIGRARFNANTRGIAVPDAVADIVVNTYNKNITSNRLPSWHAS